MTAEIQMLEDQINLLDASEAALGFISPEAAGRLVRLRERLATAYAEENEAMGHYHSICAARRSCEEVGIRAPKILVPLGADEAPGRGEDWGYAVEDGRRTRRL